jgi:hypothetical protein
MHRLLVQSLFFPVFFFLLLRKVRCVVSPRCNFHVSCIDLAPPGEELGCTRICSSARKLGACFSVDVAFFIVVICIFVSWPFPSPFCFVRGSSTLAQNRTVRMVSGDEATCSSSLHFPSAKHTQKVFYGCCSYGVSMCVYVCSRMIKVIEKGREGERKRTQQKRCEQTSFCLFSRPKKS